jgi:RNA polymerase sigma-70 factor (ECF subfamily)
VQQSPQREIGEKIMSDEHLICMFEARDGRVIGIVDERYGNYCGTIAFNILHSGEDTEECLNDTWMKAWNVIPPERPCCLRTFLGKITRNLSLNMLKRKNTIKRGSGAFDIALDELSECVSDGFDVEENFDNKAIVKCIENFLEELSPEHRNIFIRRYWHLCSIEQVADDYDLTVSNVKQILFRQRKQLKASLSEAGIEL